MVEIEEDVRRLEHFKLVKKLGDGTFGVGWEAVDTTSNDVVCVKVFKDDTAISEKSFKDELNIGYLQLEHPNVIRMLGAGRNHLTLGEEDLGEKYFIVSELAENGELFDFVQEAGGLEAEYVRQFMQQLMSGMAYIHSKKVAHRDMKLENCFLDSDVCLKIADFGLHKVFEGEDSTALRT
jgi:serine/threonine protein kinase